MNLRHSAIAARMPPADGAIRPYTVPSRSSLALIVRVDDVIQTVSAALGGMEDRRRTRAVEVRDQHAVLVAGHGASTYPS